MEEAGSMVKYTLLAVTFALLMASRPAWAQDANAGKAAYTKSCASCHAVDGAPKEAIAKMLKVEIPHLGAKEVQDKSDADLGKVITEGYQKMKAVKGLSDKDVANVIAFMRTLKQS
jgi:mono/diheme cytochrome c family protein